MVGGGLFSFLSLAALIGIAYAKTPVPDQGNEEATKTAAIFYYRDGKTEIGRLGTNRVPVTFDQIPEHVRYAAIAAENRTFYTDSGFSIKGITRAVWNNLTGGETQGGSTITQQLAKNYYLTPEQTMSRKFKEMFISLKLEDKLGSKDKILELYLNTIYFGRNSYGIQAAAKSYFGKDVSKLTPDEGALLAAIIQQPGRFDPRSDDPEAVKETQARYLYVLDGMRKMGKLSDADYAKYSQRLPETKEIGGTATFGGQNGYMIKRALRELQRDQGITEDEVIRNGLRVITTFDRKKMIAAKQAVEKSVPGVDPEKLLKQHVRLGLTSVNTTNGEVEAIYGGPDYLKQSFDNVWAGSAQAGSAMKPYVLATALKNGWSLRTTVENRSGVSFNGSGQVVAAGTPGALAPIRNSHSGPAAIDLVKAIQESSNTGFVQLALKVGVPNVAETAESVGISSDLVEPYKNQAGLALGINDIRPIEQAAGYAVFANGGTYYQPHVVREVRTKDNAGKYKELSWKKRTGVFSETVTRDVTYAMQQVVKPGGTATAAALSDRPVAGKTGTTEKNVATWFIGFTANPKLSTAVTMFNDKKKTLYIPGLGEISGGAVPARIWHAYTAAVAQGTTPEQFAPPAFGGSQQSFGKTTPTPTASATPEDRETEEPDCSDPRNQNNAKCAQQTTPTTPTPCPGNGNGNGNNCTPTSTPTQGTDQICKYFPNRPECQDGGDDDDDDSNDPTDPKPQQQSTPLTYTRSRP
ncbi:transglycosylase domain-containing protein [Actinomadura sp. NBRC 104425]|uniref:transglycosylase domain-containing protein n=1 Tax=Actinomadura sp. NBRC 104425 TaxID=3032204 RepID=UPI002556FE84|nr:transglycosylase domain-containing protein [Actinomadura sp. NBRC 104425]